MLSNKISGHLSDEQIAQFQDGELSGGAAGHLQSCSGCQSRLRDLESAAAAYTQYRNSIRGPQLPPPPKPWLRLSALAAQQRSSTQHRLLQWWPAAAAALCILFVVAILVPSRRAAQASRQTNELLTRSTYAVEPEGRLISMSFRGRRMIRPAVLETTSGDAETSELRTMFSSAGYSWRDPLSARSFQSWRSRLSRKRDSVSVLQREGEKRSYRVRTDSPTGILQSVSLTLRAEDLRPTNGSFSFEGERNVESFEVPKPTPPTPRTAERAIASQQPTMTAEEQPATPEDTLHVLAALNKIGADIGEPIHITEDPQQRNVVVQVGALASERRQQVTEALRALPRVVLRFGAVRAAPRVPTQARTEPSSSNIPEPLRQQFEERAGGAIRLQQITDEVLDSGSLLLARTHALNVLGEKFPPAIEAKLGEADRLLLERLRQRHMAALDELLKQLRTLLTPVMLLRPRAQGTDMPVRNAWQSGAATLVALAAEMDGLLNQLFAGSYSQSAGEEMLKKTNHQMERLESLVRQHEARIMRR